jgi:hypothetical protein
VAVEDAVGVVKACGCDVVAGSQEAEVVVAGLALVVASEEMAAEVAAIFALGKDEADVEAGERADDGAVGVGAVATAAVVVVGLVVRLRPLPDSSSLGVQLVLAVEIRVVQC